MNFIYYIVYFIRHSITQCKCYLIITWYKCYPTNYIILLLMLLPTISIITHWKSHSIMNIIFYWAFYLSLGISFCRTYYYTTYIILLGMSFSFRHPQVCHLITHVIIYWACYYLHILSLNEHIISLSISSSTGYIITCTFFHLQIMSSLTGHIISYYVCHYLASM